jgi:hypothetical protein
MAARKFECFEPSPWLLAASEWGVERSPSKYHISPAYLSYGTNARARKGAFEAGRDRFTATFRILRLRGDIFPVLPEISRLRLLREFGCRRLIYQMIFGMLSDLRRGIGKFLGYFPGSREFDR